MSDVRGPGYSDLVIRIGDYLADEEEAGRAGDLGNVLLVEARNMLWELGNTLAVLERALKERR